MTSSKKSTLLAAALGGLALAPAILADTAHTVRPGYGAWWLPYNYSKHGGAIDGMFSFIFWLTMIVFVLVEVVLVYFLVKYRHDPKRAKGKFIHGNTRLEMIWTLIPAVILAVLALASKRIWERYRYADLYKEYGKSEEAEVLVVAEQFKWNFVYPGKDGKLGQYLDFPRPSDPKFRALNHEKAMSAINKYIPDENPLGQNQDWTDEESKAGQDDDYDHNPGRPLILPVDRPIAIRLSSKDVIHDFFLPNFRVKLDALPGMNGRVNFTALPEALSTEEMSLDDKRLVDAAARADKKQGTAFKIWVDANTPGAVRLGTEGTPASQVNYALNGKLPDGTAKPVPSREPLSTESIASLKAAGVKRVTALTKPYELVCEELCGQGHYSMGGIVYFVTPEQYKAFNEKPPVRDRPSEQPPVASVSATTIGK